MQASVLDGFAFDPFSFQQDGLTASEVDVGRRQIVDALVVAQVTWANVTIRARTSSGMRFHTRSGRGLRSSSASGPPV